MAETVAYRAERKPAHPALLLKKLGFTGVLVFALSGIGLSTMGSIPFTTLAGLFAGIDLAGMVLVMAAAAAFLSILYSVIGTVIPRYGADYCLSSRVISPPLAFASSLTSVILFSLFSGSLVASIFHTTVPNLIRVLSIVTYDEALSNQAAVVSEPYAVTLSGTLLIVILFILLILPPKTTHRILLAGFGFSLLAWVILSLQLSQAVPGVFPAAWDSFFGDGSFLQRLQLAGELGMQNWNRPGSTVFAGLLLGFGLFTGFLNSTNISAEIDRPHKNLWQGNLAALAIWTAAILAAALLLRRHVSYDWLSAQSFLYLSHDQAIQVMPFVPFYAAILQPNPGIAWLVGVCWMFGTLTMAHAFLYSSSRVILAWVNDHLLPHQVGFIHPGLKSPLVTVLLVCILAEFGVMAASMDNSLFQPLSMLFLLSGGMILPVVAVTLLPFRNKGWFKAAPGWARVFLGPVPLLTVLGSLAVLYLAAMMAAFLFFRPIARIGPELPVLVIFLVVFISGLAWFSGRRSLLLANGENIDSVFDDLPV